MAGMHIKIISLFVSKAMMHCSISKADIMNNKGSGFWETTNWLSKTERRHLFSVSPKVQNLYFRACLIPAFHYIWPDYAFFWGVGSWDSVKGGGVGSISGKVSGLPLLKLLCFCKTQHIVTHHPLPLRITAPSGIKTPPQVFFTQSCYQSPLLKPGINMYDWPSMLHQGHRVLFMLNG